MALGRTRLLAGVSLAYAVVHLPVFVAGTARFGLRGAVGAIVVAGVLYSWLNAWMLKRALDVTLGEILAQLRRPLVAAVLMAAAVLTLAAASPLDLSRRRAPCARSSSRLPSGPPSTSRRCTCSGVAGAGPRGSSGDCSS